jgi:hypothetical protein
MLYLATLMFEIIQTYNVLMQTIFGVIKLYKYVADQDLEVLTFLKEMLCMNLAKPNRVRYLWGLEANALWDLVSSLM